MGPRPLSTRKADLLYLVSFVIHLVIALTMDLPPFYPTSIVPDFMLKPSKYYIETYKDQFFVNPPRWFSFYMVLEGMYHIPLSIWAIFAILRGNIPTVWTESQGLEGNRVCWGVGAVVEIVSSLYLLLFYYLFLMLTIQANDPTDDPLVPLHLLIWAVQTATVTATCVVDFTSWDGITRDEKVTLAQLYVPYIAFGTYVHTSGVLELQKNWAGFAP